MSHRLFVEDEHTQDALRIRSNFPHFSSMGYFTGDLLPGQVPYTKNSFRCFNCGKVGDIFSGDSVYGKWWLCHGCDLNIRFGWCKKLELEGKGINP